MSKKMKLSKYDEPLGQGLEAAYSNMSTVVFTYDTEISQILERLVSKIAEAQELYIQTLRDKGYGISVWRRFFSGHLGVERNIEIPEEGFEEIARTHISRQFKIFCLDRHTHGSVPIAETFVTNHKILSSVEKIRTSIKKF